VQDALERRRVGVRLVGSAALQDYDPRRSDVDVPTVATRLFEGTDVPLIRDGRFLDRFLRREGLRRADVEAALRAKGADGAGDVAEAGLGPGGSIVVWLKPTRRPATRADIDALHRRLDALDRAIEATTRVDPPRTTA